MISFKSTGPVGGDETQPFDVILDKEYTVEEFVRWVLLNRSDEWGYIRVIRRGTDQTRWNCPILEYRKGHVITPFAVDLRDERIIKATARGGWTAMDYVLTIDDDMKYIDKERKEKEMYNGYKCNNCMYNKFSSIDVCQRCKNGNLYEPNYSRQVSYVSYGKKMSKMGRFSIKNVIFNGPATIVFWTDGTKTVVKAQKYDSFDPEKGLAMAIAKRALGDKGNYYNEIKKWLEGDE